MHAVSMLGQKNCGTKDYEIKIANRNSNIARIAKLKTPNEKNFIEIPESRSMNSK